MSYQSFEDLESQPTCYICLDVCSEKQSFCKCINSRCHQKCIEKWAIVSGKSTCSVCLSEYQIPLTTKNLVRFLCGVCLEFVLFLVTLGIVYTSFGMLSIWAPDIFEEETLLNWIVRGAIVYHSSYTGYSIAEDFTTHYFQFSWNFPVLFLYRIIYHTLYRAFVAVYATAVVRRSVRLPGMVV